MKDIDVNLNKWFPAKIDIKVPVYIRAKLNIGLWLCYSDKAFTTPANLAFVTDGRLVDFDNLMIKNENGIIRLSVRWSKKLGTWFLNIEMLKPKTEPKKEPKYRLLVVAPFDETKDERNTIENGEVIKHLIWVGRSHSEVSDRWRDYYVFLLPIGMEVTIKHTSEKEGVTIITY